MYLLDGLTRPVIMTFLILIAFMVFSPSFNPLGLPESAFEKLMAAVQRLIFVIAMFMVLFDTLKLLSSVRRMRNPEIFGIEIIDFASNAKSNGFESNVAKELIIRLVKSNIFNDVQKDSLKAHVLRSYPEGATLMLEANI